MIGSMVNQLAGFSEGFKPKLGKGAGINVDWRWFPPCAGNFTARSNKDVRDVNYVAGGKEDSTTTPDKRVENTSIL